MGRKIGHIVTKETREKISKKISLIRKGWKLSEETKRKIGLKNSIALRGNIPWNKGIKWKNPKKSIYMKNKFKQNPNLHPNRIMAQKGFISKPQLELFYLIKTKYPNAELEYPIQTNYSLRFADIAIPSLKIDIEYDGQHWHQNKEWDDLRDEHLREIGWKTIRIKNLNEIKITELG